MTGNVALPATGAGTMNLNVAGDFDGSGFVQSLQLGRKLRLSVTPAITSGSAYAPGQAIGGLLRFVAPGRLSGAANGSIVSRGLIRSMLLLDRDKQQRLTDVALFAASFTAAADRAAFDPSWADMANLIGVVTFLDWIGFANGAVARADLTLPYVAQGADLWGQLIAREAPTFTTTSSLTVILNAEAE